MNLVHSVEEAANKTYTENGAVTLARAIIRKGDVYI